MFLSLLFILSALAFCVLSKADFTADTSGSMFSHAALRTYAVVFVIFVILVHFPKDPKRFYDRSKLRSFLLNLSHIFYFFAMCAPQVFHMPRSSHTSGRFRRISPIPAIGALKYPDFVFMLFHSSAKRKMIASISKNTTIKAKIHDNKATRNPCSITSIIKNKPNQQINISEPTIFLITFFIKSPISQFLYLSPGTL